ncbi:unnamed protein product [Auanema sp. JU1783]|nr:unnamed protein product [Auanema sp. JU1783]
MRNIVIFCLAIQPLWACFRTDYRSYQYGAPTQQFAQAPPAASQQFVQPARVAAAARAPNQPIISPPSKSIFASGSGSMHEYSAEGYNAEGGGPVNTGSSLSCDFDDKPCCWANVPQPDDQLDWTVAKGQIDAARFPSAPYTNTSYLLVHANGAAPSDEAQLASCSIGCASSEIIVRVKHWQTESVLLQVCLRESFPNDVQNNALLSCQELPPVNQLTTTEITLPAASLVDVVFVASNLVDENGDIAIIDDVQVFYKYDEDKCRNLNVVDSQHGASHKQSFEASKHQTIKIEQGREKQFKAQTSENGEIEVLQSLKTPSRTQNQTVALGTRTKTFNENACVRVKCDFESGSLCNYKDAQHTQNSKVLTSRFQVARGHFMNRVTGVKESSEGDFYAASFLFPREVAGLATTIEPLKENTRIRFRYYEGTHGVQLKACCGTHDSCPFSSDKFVSVLDRVWKTTSFKCPVGTDKILFLCENVRTNQGACAVDDIAIIEEGSSLETANPLC